MSKTQTRLDALQVRLTELQDEAAALETKIESKLRKKNFKKDRKSFRKKYVKDPTFRMMVKLNRDIYRSCDYDVHMLGLSEQVKR